MCSINKNPVVGVLIFVGSFMDNRVLHWLAGLLEGEGSFLKPPPSDPNRPRISLQMTDRDIIERVNMLFGMKYFKTEAASPEENRKACYHVCLRGRKAVVLMKELYTLMGLRRRAQIEVAITCHRPKIHLPDPVPAIVDENVAWWKLPDNGTHSPLTEDENEFYWLAGLLEGEGSFFQGPPSKANQPRIQIMMTDEDIIARVAQLFARSYLVSRKDRGGIKPIYITSIRGRNAVEWMRRLRPLMGQRRQGQIDSAIRGYIYHEPSGSRHHNAKLDEKSVVAIRDRLAEGESQTTLAHSYGVDTSLIWQIKAGRIWQHVR